MNFNNNKNNLNKKLIKKNYLNLISYIIRDVQIRKFKL